MPHKDEIPQERRLYCGICKMYYDARDLVQVLPHLRHNPNFPQDFELPEHYNTRIDGDSKEFLDGKE